MKPYSENLFAEKEHSNHNHASSAMIIQGNDNPCYENGIAFFILFSAGRVILKLTTLSHYLSEVISPSKVRKNYRMSNCPPPAGAGGGLKVPSLQSISDLWF